MGKEENLLRIIDNIYGAALEPALWTPTLINIADEMGGSGNAFFIFDKKNVMATLSSYARMPDGLGGEYEDHYLQICPRYAYDTQSKEGAIFIDQDCIGDQKIEKLEYYDFLSRYDLKYFCGLTVFNNDSWFSGLAVQRSPRQGPFPQNAADLLRLLFPHLRRAA